jgi:WhiB family transcriptional regulator, redox-sensing transcriptional regulator
MTRFAECSDEPGCVGDPREDAVEPIGRRSPVGLPCQVHDPELWFADNPVDLERAKALCAECPALSACFNGALRRREPAGVWGGQIFQDGRIIPFKRRRGRPRKNAPVFTSSSAPGPHHASLHHPAPRSRTH